MNKETETTQVDAEKEEPPQSAGETNQFRRITRSVSQQPEQTISSIPTRIGVKTKTTTKRSVSQQQQGQRQRKEQVNEELKLSGVKAHSEGNLKQVTFTNKDEIAIIKSFAQEEKEIVIKNQPQFTHW